MCLKDQSLDLCCSTNDLPEWFVLLPKSCRHMWFCWWSHYKFLWLKFRECLKIAWQKLYLCYTLAGKQLYGIEHRLMTSNSFGLQTWPNISKDFIEKSNVVKLLWITVDKDLKFDKHVLKLYEGQPKLKCFSWNGKIAFLFKRKTHFKTYM